MFLLLKDKQFEVAGCLENKVTLRTPQLLEPAQGELVIIIDGKEKRKRIFLKAQLNQLSPEFEFEIM